MLILEEKPKYKHYGYASDYEFIDIKTIPMWVWLALGGVVAVFLLLKKKGIKGLISKMKRYEEQAEKAKKKAEALREYIEHLKKIKELKAKLKA